MCRGKGVPGSRTNSSGNRGRRGTQSPIRDQDATTRFYDIALRHLDLIGGPEYNPSMELAGKVIVVTGASMGIGEAIAKLFAEQGAGIVLLSRDSSRAESARTRIGFPDRTAA